MEKYHKINYLKELGEKCFAPISDSGRTISLFYVSTENFESTGSYILQSVILTPSRFVSMKNSNSRISYVIYVIERELHVKEWDWFIRKFDKEIKENRPIKGTEIVTLFYRNIKIYEQNISSI